MSRWLSVVILSSSAAFAAVAACSGNEEIAAGSAGANVKAGSGGEPDSSAGGWSGSGAGAGWSGSGAGAGWSGSGGVGAWSGGQGQSGGDGAGPYPLDGGVCGSSVADGTSCWGYTAGSNCDFQCAHCVCSDSHDWSCSDTCDGSVPVPQDGGACPADVKTGDDCSNLVWGSTCESAGVSCYCYNTGKWACGTPCDEAPTEVNGQWWCPSCAANGASCFSTSSTPNECLVEAGECHCSWPPVTWSCDGGL